MCAELAAKWCDAKLNTSLFPSQKNISVLVFRSFSEAPVLRNSSIHKLHPYGSNSRTLFIKLQIKIWLISYINKMKNLIKWMTIKNELDYSYLISFTTNTSSIMLNVSGYTKSFTTLVLIQNFSEIILSFCETWSPSFELLQWIYVEIWAKVSLLLHHYLELQTEQGLCHVDMSVIRSRSWSMRTLRYLFLFESSYI